MNKLEEAAKRYAEEHPHDERFGFKYGNGIVYPRKNCDIAKVFAAGAEWALQNQWISVEDRSIRPPKDEDVFLLFEDGSVANHHSNWEEKLLLVTHWMPIPKLPTKNK